MARLETQYRDQVVPALMKQFGYTSVMAVPRLQKIVVNMGVGDAIQDAKVMDSAAEELGTITGQKPSVRRAKKSISNFKLREGVPIGCRVTLRKEHMYEFLDRLVSVALPRVRDFRGVSDKSFDGHGNYTLGIKEQIVFPEIDVDKVARITNTRGSTGAVAKGKDFIEHLFIASTHDYILFFTNLGRCYWLKVHELPQVGKAGKGRAIINMVHDR